MKVVYENTARDFQTITDEKERSILYEYSERGRRISLGFISKFIPTYSVRPCSYIRLFTVEPMLRHHSYLMYYMSFRKLNTI